MKQTLAAAVALWCMSAFANEAALMTANNFRAALSAGDADGALATLADDVVVYEHGGAERSRAEYASHHLAADMAYLANIQAELMAQHVIAGDGMVVITRETRQTGTHNGRDVDRTTTETLVLTASPDGWRIRHVHWSG